MEQQSSTRSEMAPEMFAEVEAKQQLPMRRLSQKARPLPAGNSDERQSRKLLLFQQFFTRSRCVEPPPPPPPTLTSANRSRKPTPVGSSAVQSEE